ncbi:MAG: prepilin-type N-terminal cleavage/methylation domain-containing protein [Gemmatimonadota bacterium]
MRGSSNVARGLLVETGFSLIEVLIAITLLAIGLLALGSAAGQSIRQSSLSAMDVETWADTERIADSLTSVGWSNVSGGSETHAHHSLAWSVASPSSNLDRVTLVISRWGAMGYGMRQDTITLSLAKPVP